MTNLTNSKRLYELSGWQDTGYYWRFHKPNGASKLYTTEEMDADNFRFANTKEAPRFREENEFFPAYTSDYLLEKLPAGVTLYKKHLGANDDYEAFLVGSGWVSADTPADSLALLAIKLFENGILK